MSAYVIILTFGAMILWGIGDFLVCRMSKKIGSLKALIFVNLGGALILFPFIIKSLPQIDLVTLTPLFILSIFDFAFGLTLLKAYERGKLSVVEIIMIMELPLTVICGLIFFQEKLNVWQISLILLILTGVFFMAKEKQSFRQKLSGFIFKRGRYFEKGVAVAFIAAILSAFYNFFIAYNAKEVSPFLVIWLPWTLSLIYLLIYSALKHGVKKSLAQLQHHFLCSKKLIIFGSIIDVVAWLCFAGALAQKELSITTAITESYPALAMFLGIKFNKEKISGLQYIGAMLALGGSVVIALIS